jgi:hypothetical protein
LQPDERNIDPYENYHTDPLQLLHEDTQAPEGVKAFEALLRATQADKYHRYFAGLVGI